MKRDVGVRADIVNIAIRSFHQSGYEVDSLWIACVFVANQVTVFRTYHPFVREIEITTLTTCYFAEYTFHRLGRQGAAHNRPGGWRLPD